jgi:hypothetical protein
MGNLILLYFPAFTNISIQFSNADYAMVEFTKVSGRRSDESPLPDQAHRSKSD